MGGIQCSVLFWIMLLPLSMVTSAPMTVCPTGESLSFRRSPLLKYPLPGERQRQELRCHFPIDNAHTEVKLFWTKHNQQVSNTSDGRLTIYEDVVRVAKNISHSCLHSQNTTLLRSILSIRNIEKKEYGLYECYGVLNHTGSSKMEKGALTFFLDMFMLNDPNGDFWLKHLYHGPKLTITKRCKAKLTCQVRCFDCCTCATGSCEMVLMKADKMVTSSTSVSLDDHIFKTSFKIFIDELEDFGEYNCVLKQQVLDCVDGSMFKTSIDGQLLHLPRPKAFTKNPSATIKAGEVLFSCHYEASLTSAVYPWEIKLEKDGKEVVLNASLTSRKNFVEASFAFNVTVDVYGRYECILKQKGYSCLKNALFNMVSLEEPANDSAFYLTPSVGYSWINEIFNRTCHFRVEHQEDEDIYEIVMTLNRYEIHRLSAELKPMNNTNLTNVSACFEIKVMDPSSFGLYECVLMKNGLPQPSEAEQWSYHWQMYINKTLVQKKEIRFTNNKLQLSPMTNWTFPERVEIKGLLGHSVYLPCYTKAKGDVPTGRLAWYRDGVEITDDDRHTTLKVQIFRMLNEWTSFLWCIVKPENADAFGKYECRSRNDTESNGSMTTLQTFHVEPHSWKDQAQVYYKEKVSLMSYLDSSRSIIDQQAETLRNLLDATRTFMDTAFTWKSWAIRSSTLLGIIFTAAFISFCVMAFLFVKRKLDERDIRITLHNIHQMKAVGEGSTEASHRYDVFISYSSADASWVRDDLLGNLESNGYTVCLDTRDFALGKPVLTNIAIAIYQSRKVILVMSKNFIKSGWCCHELVLTYQRKLDQNENCVIVMKFDDCEIPKEIGLRTYLDWTEPMARETFWTKLHDWLGPPSPPPDSDIEEVDQEESEELLAIKESETCQREGADQTDDIVLRQRQNISSNGCD